MTNEEYGKYYWVTRDVFKRLNGDINPRMLCILDIQKIDPSGSHFAEITFPNRITIYLQPLMDGYYASGLSNSTGLHDYMCTNIIWTLVHELMHSEQLLNLSRYKTHRDYNLLIESAVEYESYRWVSFNIGMFERMLNFHSCIDRMTSTLIRESNQPQYIRGTLKDLYLGIIKYIIFDQVDLSLLDHEEEYCDISINFERAMTIWIKHDWEYIPDNLTPFANYVTLNVARFDYYTVKCKAYVFEDGPKRLELNISFEDRMINPVYFNEPN